MYVSVSFCRCLFFTLFSIDFLPFDMICVAVFQTWLFLTWKKKAWSQPSICNIKKSTKHTSMQDCATIFRFLNLNLFESIPRSFRKNMHFQWWLSVICVHDINWNRDSISLTINLVVIRSPWWNCTQNATREKKPSIFLLENSAMC